MKISEFKDEAALDLLADILEPVSEIIADPEVKAAFEGNKKIKAVSVMIKNHKPETLTILARLAGKPVDEFECNVFTLPLKILEILNDKTLIDFFSSQAQMTVNISSGSVTENTEEIVTI